METWPYFDRSRFGFFVELMRMLELFVDFVRLCSSGFENCFSL